MPNTAPAGPADNPPSGTPAFSTPSTSPSRRKLAFWIAGLTFAIVLVGVLVGVSITAAKIAGDVVAKELRYMNEQNDKALEWMKNKSDNIEDRLVEIEDGITNIPFAPPNNDKLFSILSRGIGVTEDVIRTGQVGTTPQSAFVTDLTAAQQNDAWTQEIVITNRDDASAPAQNLCFRPIAWAAAGATCNDKCVASGFTCPVVGGAGTTATDGVITARGASWNRRYDGTSCLCILGSAAGTDYQTERVLRRRSKRKVIRRRFRFARGST